MGLFSKKSEKQKKAENKIDELCGGFLGNDMFKNLLKKNNLDETTSNTYYKSVLKNEVKNKTLNYEDIESRLDELMKLDVEVLNNKIRFKQDTSLFKTQQDINEFLGEKYVEKYYKTLEKKQKKRVKNSEKEKSKIKKLEDKFNIDLSGKKLFECSIEEIKYSTFTNQPQRNIDTAYVMLMRIILKLLKKVFGLNQTWGHVKFISII